MTTPSHPPTHSTSRRNFLRRGVLGGSAALAAPALATAQGRTVTWRVETFMPGGAGLQAFRAWCASIIEKTEGALAFEAYDPSNSDSGLDIYLAASSGQREAVHASTIYSQRLFPAGVFLSSYPMAMRANAEWDVFYYALGGLEITRELFARQGLYFIGPVHHGPNIIHSKKPIYRVDDFRGLRMRMPGGMVADLFKSLGSEVVSLPGSQIFGALQRGEIDAADYVGPAVNYDLGFSKETDFISLGPPGYMSVYQPVDLTDITARLDAWQALSPQLRFFLENEVQAFSNAHHAAIQKADQEAWAKFDAEGTRVIRLSSEDVRVMTNAALPIWVEYAKRDPDSARLFKIQLDYMTSGSLGYVEKVLADIISADLL
ncbi:MAG: TRAP transporter substrate-binding protein DctP [Pseudomonadota bacterium]